MRVSQLFTKTTKNVPADEVSKNARLLIQAGYIHKEMAGVYDYLPLGQIVLNNIMQIIREEMNAIGGQELLLSALQPKDLWEASGRWSDDKVDVWFKTRMHSGDGPHQGAELGLGWTQEEPLTALMRNHIRSYKDLPIYAYQLQTKFRNELRSKSGIMRCREFIMKDMYSFSRSQEEHDAFYEKAKQAYLNVFKRVGLGKETYLTFASGGAFSQFSHEFQTITDVGEDTVYVHEGKKLAINKEVYTDEVLRDLGVSKDELVEKRAVEVGNIFTLGTRFSDPLGLKFTDQDGTEKPVIMGCYGLGPGRVMGTIVEHMGDDKGIVWPEEIAPFKVYLARLGEADEVMKEADKLYEDLTKAGVLVLYDDRNDARAGEKFADADLLGIPYRLVVSDKTLATQQVELKKRTAQEVQMLSRDAVIKTIVQPVPALV
jgi:prolyl-tRNA synthetase